MLPTCFTIFLLLKSCISNFLIQTGWEYSGCINNVKSKQELKSITTALNPKTSQESVWGAISLYGTKRSKTADRGKNQLYSFIPRNSSKSSGPLKISLAWGLQTRSISPHWAHPEHHHQGLLDQWLSIEGYFAPTNIWPCLEMFFYCHDEGEVVDS